MFWTCARIVAVGLSACCFLFCWPMFLLAEYQDWPWISLAGLMGTLLSGGVLLMFGSMYNECRREEEREERQERYEREEEEREWVRERDRLRELERVRKERWAE